MCLLSFSPSFLSDFSLSFVFTHYFSCFSINLSFSEAHCIYHSIYLSIYLYIFKPQSKQLVRTLEEENMSPAASTRWCPTTEQLMILEEMYRGGIRTPNASQIQQITTHLSFYGKIEGKNVFYWFQNHKARDRQKLRRKQSRQQQPPLQHQTQHHHLFRHIHASCSPVLQQIPHYNSTQFLSQGELEDGSAQVMNYTWKVDSSERGDMEKSKGMYGHDWMVMMTLDMGPTTTCCEPPLKTLELFPITTTGLKDECTGSSKHFSLS